MGISIIIPLTTGLSFIRTQHCILSGDEFISMKISFLAGIPIQNGRRREEHDQYKA